MPSRSPLLLLSAVALSLCLAGCGGVDPSEQARIDGVGAAARTAGQRTARFEVVDVERERAVEFRNQCAGAVDIERRRYRLVCTQGQEETLGFELLRFEGVEYTRWLDHSESTNAGEEWRSATVRRGDGEDALTVLDPVSLLARLRSATREVETVGPDEVRGFATEHVRMLVERNELDLDASAGEAGSETVWIDVWVDAEGLIRRLRIERGHSARATLEFFDFGAAVAIEPPPSNRVTELGETEFEPEPCATTASPLTEATVVAVLRRHGIGLRRDGDTCHAPDVAAELMNLPFDAPDAEAEQDAVRRREGVVWCFLHARPRAEAPTTVERDGEDVEVAFSLSNLECTIFPEGDASAEQIRRVERAFGALARSLP